MAIFYAQFLVEYGIEYKKFHNKESKKPSREKGALFSQNREILLKVSHLRCQKGIRFVQNV